MAACEWAVLCVSILIPDQDVAGGTGFWGIHTETSKGEDGSNRSEEGEKAGYTGCCWRIQRKCLKGEEEAAISVIERHSSMSMPLLLHLFPSRAARFNMIPTRQHPPPPSIVTDEIPSLPPLVLVFVLPLLLLLFLLFLFLINLPPYFSRISSSQIRQLQPRIKTGIPLLPSTSLLLLFYFSSARLLLEVAVFTLPVLGIGVRFFDLDGSSISGNSGGLAYSRRIRPLQTEPTSRWTAYRQLRDIQQ